MALAESGIGSPGGRFLPAINHRSSQAGRVTFIVNGRQKVPDLEMTLTVPGGLVSTLRGRALLWGTLRGFPPEHSSDV